MRNILLGASLCVAVASGFLLYGGSVQAQDAGSVDNRRAQLQAQLDQLEAQIETQQQILDTKTLERASLERDVTILNAQIKKSQLSIKARDLQIQQLTTGIVQKEDTIFGLNQKLNAELDSLASILREKNELDKTSLVIAALSSQSLSDFFSDLETFDSINTALQDSFVALRDTRISTETQKTGLENQRGQETQLRQVQQLEQQELTIQEAQKSKLIKDTKGQEKVYQTLITENKKSAAQIRAALFELSGSAAIPFGRALEYAMEAQQKTGVRPAFLLGIIAEESNLGENVGSGTWTVDMHPTRDAPIFQKITASLGLNADTMPVSKKAWYGWGGAMGPAQFIPSTWVLYAGYPKPDYVYDQNRDRIGKLTGNTPPNPWNPEDAFMASALLLTDNGAGGQTRATEFRSAMCYLAGCGNANNKSLQFYGNDVMNLAAKYQAQIDILNGN